MAATSSSPHDLVVIGASAGGVEVLQRVVAGLPADLPAAVCVVLHLAPGSPSALARILSRAGSLPCEAARDGARLEPGHIYVAPPDHHLTIANGHVRLTVGPRENGHRPSVDALFRSASADRDGHTVGVVLSGTRDDGAVGLATIKAAGGCAVVQDPQEATYGGMPRSAIAQAQIDAVVPSDRIAATVVAMVRGDGGNGAPERHPPADEGPEEPASTLTTICPECGGVLTERGSGGLTQWACRVGHRYSMQSLLDAQGEDVEAALWAAVRALEDRQMLLRRLAERFSSHGPSRSSDGMLRRAAEAAEQADVVRRALTHAAGHGALGPIELDPEEAAGAGIPADAEARG